MKGKVGAVLVKNNRILSTGYNGTPEGFNNCYEGGCHRCNTNTESGKDLDKCLCIHAEINCILEIGQKKCKGAIIYTTTYPCNWCARTIV